MNKKYIGIIGASLILVLGVGAYAIYKNNEGRPSESQATNATQADTASDVYEQYSAMKGETYDRNFIANMISHHRGAVDMAELAQTNATRTEIKAMADDIILAQEKEIADMLAWQEAWGYPSTSAEDMQDHSAMGMMDSMAGMMAELEGKTGDDFDKAFIEQMILHHQGAIDMAAPGKENALRQEVKDLSSRIVNDQKNEIAKMKEWQNEWGI